MKCKNHPGREASHFCASCNIPICDDCAEEVNPGQFFCFNCAMLQTVSVVGTSLVDRHTKSQEKKLKKKKEWGPFHYFVIASSVLIVVMWGVIIFSGEKAPGKRIDFASQERVFLFMVNGSIKRYYAYEKNRYPERLEDLVPRYLSIGKENLHELKRLKYIMDKNTGYQLSIANPKPGSMNIIISPNGIKYESAINQETGNG